MKQVLSIIIRIRAIDPDWSLLWSVSSVTGSIANPEFINPISPKVEYLVLYIYAYFSER